MLELIQKTWFLKRDIVSDGFDQALTLLRDDLAASGLVMTIHEFATGEQAWTWRVPEKWTCHEAYLETLDGRRVVDWKNHPLHVVSYSLPFEGVVGREELLNHLHVHPKLPEAIPYVFKYYERDWGLCCSQVIRESLTEDRYRVVIRTSFDPGTLKVGEVVVPGESDETFVLVAHLCHPAMVNDDLTGVVVGLETLVGYNQKVAFNGPRPYYTLRLLILPETVGSVAYLSRHESLIPKMMGGLFLEMLGNQSPHALQGSFQPGSQADRTLRSALRGLDLAGYSAPYRTVINNDERQFNAPGVRIPMLSLSRVEPPDSPTRPYREYHSSLDTPEIISQERLEASCDLVLGLLCAFDKNQFVVNDFKGEIFCSGYGIWIDYRLNPEGHRRLFEIMERCDGEHTLADIADELQISFNSVDEIIGMLKSKGLVHLSRIPEPTDPHRK